MRALSALDVNLKLGTGPARGLPEGSPARAQVTQMRPCISVLTRQDVSTVQTFSREKLTKYNFVFNK